MPDQELIARLEAKREKYVAHLAGIDEALEEARSAPDPEPPVDVEEDAPAITAEAGLAEAHAVSVDR